jgi:3D (Asp-Asp-Asp) domain-containing protein
LFKLKRHVIRRYILLSICLMGIGIDSLNIGAKSIPVNKVVEGRYQESSNKEKDETKNKKEEEIEASPKIPTETPKETPVEAKKEETVAKQSEKKQEVVGRAIKAELTAYSDDPRSSEQWGSQTAMQTHTRLGVIAAPKNIPLGSKMYIPALKNYKADGMFDVEDRGGAIKVKADGTYVIDVWVPSHEEALEFGRKKTTIYLVEK